MLRLIINYIYILSVLMVFNYKYNNSKVSDNISII